MMMMRCNHGKWKRQRVLNKQINDETECDDCTSEGSLVAMNCFAWMNIINL